MERGKHRHIESNFDDICHEEDSDVDCVDSMSKPELISFGSDEKKKEDEDDKKEDKKGKENNKDESAGEEVKGGEKKKEKFGSTQHSNR